MLFLVDGYNITKGDPATCDLPLEAQRDALVARVASRGRELLGGGRIVVVFDGAGLVTGSTRDGGTVEVVYSSAGEPADDVIVGLAAAEGGNVVIVTDDRDIAGRVRVHRPGRGTEVLARTALYESAVVRRGARRGGVGGSMLGVPKGANRITKELKDLWLPEREE